MLTLEMIRSAELSAVRGLFPPNASVLEIGGGSGYQALILSKIGLHVKSIDVCVDTGGQNFFPVDIYDGSQIPYADSTFDVVYSSNVLEHVKDLNAVMSEIHRILKPNGIAIHILPTPVWRFWTSVSHYGYLLTRIFGVAKVIPGGCVPSLKDKVKKAGLFATIIRALWAGPHGEYPSAISEMWFFSSVRWKQVFEKSGFLVNHNNPVGLFYTGYGLAPSLTVRSRCMVARILGSSTCVYVLSKF